MSLEHLTQENFDEKTSKGTVLVDFFATWCGPCRMLSPILEQVADEVGEDVKLYKVDIDECLDIAKKFGVMSVPTMVVLKDGAEVQRLIGLRQKAQILDVLKK